MIVPVAVGSAASVAFDGLDRVSVKVSSGSSVVSSVVGTVNVAVVWLAVTVTIPVVDPRSSACAVSPLSIDAVQVAVTSAAAASDNVTVKAMSSPSLPSASATPSVGLGVVPPTAEPVIVMRNEWPLLVSFHTPSLL